MVRLLTEPPFIPFAGPLRWLGSFDDPWAWDLRPLLGLVLGSVIAGVVVAREYRLEVADDSVVVVRGEDRRRMAE